MGRLDPPWRRGAWRATGLRTRTSAGTPHAMPGTWPGTRSIALPVSTRPRHQNGGAACRTRAPGERPPSLPDACSPLRPSYCVLEAVTAAGDRDRDAGAPIRRLDDVRTARSTLEVHTRARPLVGQALRRRVPPLDYGGQAVADFSEPVDRRHIRRKPAGCHGCRLRGGHGQGRVPAFVPLTATASRWP